MSWSNIKKSKSQKKNLAKLSSSQCTVGNVVCKIPKMAIFCQKIAFFQVISHVHKTKRTLFSSSLKVEEKKVTLSLKMWFLSQDMAILSKKSHFWPKNGHIVATPRVRLSLPVVQSSRNMTKIIKIIEKKGFRSLIGVNLENSAKNVIKLVNLKAYVD